MVKTLVLVCLLAMAACARPVLGRDNPNGPAPPLHLSPTGESIELSAWRRDYRLRCLVPAQEHQATPQTRRLQQLQHFLGLAPELEDHLSDQLWLAGSAICLDDRKDSARGYYDHHFNIIALRERLSLATQALILAHEMRHIEQVNLGYCLSTHYDINEMVRATYALEADAQAISTLFAWRLKSRGVTQPWQTYLELPHYRDIALAFKKERRRGGSLAQATREAFRQWYSSPWRRINYHHQCYTGYLDKLDDENLIQRYRKLPEGFFEGLCKLPDGKSYRCQETREIREPPGPPARP